MQIAKVLVKKVELGDIVNRSRCLEHTSQFLETLLQVASCDVGT